jgi:hypothetical protein
MKPILVRPHRGSLADSMKLVQSINNEQDLLKLIRGDCGYGSTKARAIRFSHYGRDFRTGWDTYLITVRGYVWGFANGRISGFEK